jgi:hypothetical protein
MAAFTKAEEVTKLGEAITSLTTILANLGATEAVAAGAGNVGPEYSGNLSWKATNPRTILVIERLKQTKQIAEVAQGAIQ